MFARIFRPAKTAMQSGQAKTKSWVLEFDAQTARRLDPLMGWSGAEDMTASQVRISFETKEQAVEFAEKHGLAYQIAPEKTRTPTPKAYSENFSFQRRKPWTH